MEELFKNQELTTEALRLEDEKYNEATRKFGQMISQAREYHEKLVNIKRCMLMMKDRTAKLKRRATKILEDKNREDLLEKHLEPVVSAFDHSSRR